MSKDSAQDLAYNHYEGFRVYLSSYLQTQKSQNTPSNQRASAREKLTRLTKPQFADMSTDVFDEMKRRQMNSMEVPFLPVRDDYHPKRNQARQKLATLPTSRFKDLASDVYYEVERRFPVLAQQYINNFGDDGTLQAGAVSPVLSNNSYPAKNDRIQPSSRFSPTPEDRYQSSQGSKASAGLDQLMANLGNMMNSPTTPSTTINGNSNNSSKEVEALQVRIAELEREMKSDKQQIQDLKSQLSLQAQETKDMDALLDKMTRDYKKLKEDYDNLQDDFASQQLIANDIRTEAANLLSEIKNLSTKNAELVEENKRLAAGGGGFTVDYNDNNDYAVDNQVLVLEQERIDSFYNAIDNLVIAGRGDTPTNVLVAMKAVVIASKNITEDTEVYESTATNLSFDEREDLSNVKNKLSTSLGQLMQAAKNHANGSYNNSADYLEDAATDLSNVIEDLIQVLRNCELKDKKYDSFQKNRSSYNIQELKIYLEKQTDQIVQSIQNLLYAMRQSTTYGKEFQDNITGITSIVDSLISTTQKTFAAKNANISDEMKQQGELILSDLKNANYSLEDLGNSMVNDPTSKSLKQKLASSSYEIAKFVKELISLIE